MRLLERVDEALVVATFLRGELASERFGSALRDALTQAGADETLVTHAELDDAGANTKRRAVLAAYRGEYLGTNLDGLVWSRAELRPDEVLGIRYISWDYWLEITGGSRLPADGAAYLRARGEVLPIPNGAAPLIVIRARPRARLVVVEGHLRLTALVQHADHMPSRLDVLLGEGRQLRRWQLYEG